MGRGRRQRCHASSIEADGVVAGRRRASCGFAALLAQRARERETEMPARVAIARLRETPWRRRPMVMVPGQSGAFLPGVAPWAENGQGEEVLRAILGEARSREKGYLQAHTNNRHGHGHDVLSLGPREE